MEKKSFLKQDLSLCPNPTIALHTIADTLVCNSTTFTVDSAYALLLSMFSVERKESEVLALLFVHWLLGSHDRSAASLLKCNLCTLEDILSKLETRGIVDRCAKSGPNSRFCRLDDSFIVAVRDNVPLEKAQEDIIFKILEDVPVMREHDKPSLAILEKPADSSSERQSDEEEDEDEQPMSLSDKMCLYGLDDLDEVRSRYRSTRLASSLLMFTEDLNIEERALFYGFLAKFRTHFSKPLCTTDFDASVAVLFPSCLSKLVERGLVVSAYVWDQKDNSASSDYYRISPTVASVFRGKENIINKAALSRLGTYLPPKDIKRKDLFFPESERKNMDRLLRSAMPGEYERITKALEERGLRTCISTLLYGPSGTGKTEMVRQVALETSRAILVADASKLGGIYIGEGEINFRELFMTYRYVCAVSERCPILLLDEADGVLGKRIENVNNAAAKDANTIQNVILEELNTLPGIFIATTNLFDNLDEAMYRRFMILLEFHLPDVETRKAIWLSKMPSLNADEAGTLAEKYPITGGLIDNVVSQAIVDEILYEKTITAQDLSGYCRSQKAGAKFVEKRKIGF